MIYLVLVFLFWGSVIAAIAILVLKKKWRGLSLFSLFLILLLNLFPALPVYIWIEPLIQTYHYTTSNGSFEFREVTGKGRDLQMLERQFEYYREQNPEIGNNAKVYRTFTVNILKFWKWREYLTHPRWDYPYINPKDITSS